MEETTKHYLISGRVQGVGYRAFVQRSAEALSLRGWVRNLPDGRVEAMVQGPPGVLRNFEAKLKTGPTHGHVEAVVVKELPLSAAFDNFAVRKDGREP